MWKYLTSENFVFSFVWITLTVAAVQATLTAQWGSLFLIFLTLAFTLGPTFLSSWYNIKLPRTIALTAVVFVYSALYLGEIHGFYERFWWWDVVLHGSSALIFGLIGLGILRMMQGAGTIEASAGLTSVFAFAFALALGALWEITEFFLDMTFGLNMQHASLYDTMIDLSVDAVGALVVVTLGYLHFKYKWNVLIGDVIEDFVEKHRKK